MYWNGKELITFDIETTSLSAHSGGLVCGTFKVGEGYQVGRTIEEVNEILNDLGSDIILVTYNGENYRGGFDFPFLRSSYAKQGLCWGFSNYEHLDILPLVRKYMNTSNDVIEPASKSNLSAGDVKKIAKANQVGYTTKNKTYKALEAMDSTCWLEFEKEKNVEKNDLQTVYQLFFDPEVKEEYIDGADTAKLVRQGKIDDVIRHNMNDVKRTEDVLELILYYVPSNEIWNNIKKL